MWPAMFQPGSLNIGVAKDGYPTGFADPDEGGRGVTPLDDAVIEPVVVLRWDQIRNNGLRPKNGEPRRGMGQIWPAVITVLATGDSAVCWVFRRIGSSIKRQLEIISPLHLRTHLSLTDEIRVAVDVFGKGEAEAEESA